MPHVVASLGLRGLTLVLEDVFQALKSRQRVGGESVSAVYSGSHRWNSREFRFSSRKPAEPRILYDCALAAPFLRAQLYEPAHAEPASLAAAGFARVMRDYKAAPMRSLGSRSSKAPRITLKRLLQSRMSRVALCREQCPASSTRDSPAAGALSASLLALRSCNANPNYRSFDSG